MRANVKPGFTRRRAQKKPRWMCGAFVLFGCFIDYRPVRVPVPVESMVDPLGDGFTSVLPEGLVVAAFGLPIAPGLDWPVVAPGAEVIPPLGDGLPDTPPVPAAPPEAPPAPAACAIANELVSASAPANAIVANFMGYSLAVMRGDNPRGMRDVPSPLDEQDV